MIGANWRNGIQNAYTFDDILMVPTYSDVDSRGECSLVTKCSRNIKLKIPFMSSPMDTVTETDMAIGMALEGGIGILHRFMSTEEQVEQVKKVKRHEAYIKDKPLVVGINFTLGQVLELAVEWKCKTFLVTDDELLCPDFNNSHHTNTDNTQIELPLRGIITNRDCMQQPKTSKVKDLMTPREKTIVLHYSQVTKQLARQEMLSHKLEKLPVVDDQNMIRGLINLKDLSEDLENKVLDGNGRLICGGAVGASDNDIDRAVRLVKAGCDVIVLDIANGHSQLAIRTVEQLKKELPNTDVIAGSIATGDGAERLIKAGADGIRCGIGNGSICITRVVSGCGVPQFSALMDVAPICKKYNIPLISDGGNKNSGNMCKALGVGADCIMLGRLLAGCEQSPSQEIYREGKILKVYRGMAGYGANVAKAQRQGKKEPTGSVFTPEGVEGFIPYAGVYYIDHLDCLRIQSGMSYSGARTIEELQNNVQFIRMTNNGFTESGVHGIQKIQ